MKGLPLAIVFDYEVPLIFKKGKFCVRLARAAGDETLCRSINRVLFSSKLYDACNDGGTLYDSVFDIVYNVVRERMGKEAPLREQFHDTFGRLLNVCLVPNQKFKRRVLDKVRAPVALLAVTNIFHAEKVETWEGRKTWFGASFVYAVKPCERNKTVFAMQQLAQRLAVPTSSLAYVGNVPEHEKAAHDLYIEVIPYKIPWDISSLYQRLALFRLVK